MSAYCRPGGRKVHSAICDGCDKVSFIIVITELLSNVD